MHKKAFTIAEVLIVTVVVSLLFTIILSLYTSMLTTRVEIQARQSLIENSYFMLERLNVLMSDFWIDYEEYYNRYVTWCTDWSTDYWHDFVWTWSNWYCNKFTWYWNEHWDWDTWRLYHCSSLEPVLIPSWIDDVFPWEISNWQWCWDEPSNTVLWNPQSFWQYRTSFFDVWADITGDWSLVWDDDDIDLWRWPIWINSNTWVNELYLISKDNTRRLFIRRALVSSWNYSWLWTWVSDIDRLYTLQMLRLRWFDAWENHYFDWWYVSTMYDWLIDTWTCDYAQWFICNWPSIWSAYPEYRLPSDVDDWWVNIFTNDITITDFWIEIYPVKDPSLARYLDHLQINPYIKINLETKLYAWTWANRVNPSMISDFTLSLQTLFNIRANY